MSCVMARLFTNWPELRTWSGTYEDRQHTVRATEDHEGSDMMYAPPNQV